MVFEYALLDEERSLILLMVNARACWQSLFGRRGVPIVATVQGSHQYSSTSGTVTIFSTSIFPFGEELCCWIAGASYIELLSEIACRVSVMQNCNLFIQSRP